MTNLKSFIIQEDVRRNHADKYLEFTEKYHHQFVVDLKKNLFEFWNKSVSKISKNFKISADRSQEAIFKNPKATVQLSLINHAEKLSSPRFREPIETTLSVKIPFIYSVEERQLIIKLLVESAVEAFKKTTTDWREVLNYEKRGRISPWFKIGSDHEEARLQLSASFDNEESYITLYSVRLEHGKISSKLKDFDRVYFVTLK